MRRLIVVIVLALAGILASGCSSDADVAADNLGRAAEQFEVMRRIVFLNGITDKYLMTIEGYCSVESGEHSALSGALEVTCKIGPDKYKKEFLGLSDNVTYFVEQIEGIEVDPYHYRVIFKPETIIPNIDRP
jgi:hypothetical protein